jgi:signal transduction histidine kinase
MIEPYGIKNTRIIIIGNEPQLWEKLAVEKKEEIYYILKELMTNMKKHSEANIVTLRFKKEDPEIIIGYSDNGIGLTCSGWNPDKSFKNIETRLNSIRGNYYIDPKKLKGFSIKIIIPI